MRLQRWSGGVTPLLLSLWVLAAPAQPATSPPITRAIDLRSLSAEEAAEERPVQIEAQVSFIESAGTIFVQDETGGTFFRPIKPAPNLSVGDRVMVSGVTFPGLYLTGIDRASIQVRQRGDAPPPARDATVDDLFSGRFHYQRVKVQGVVRRQAPLDESGTLLVLAIGPRQIQLHVSVPVQDDTQWVDSEVVVTGLAAGGINDRRQLVQPYLRVANWDDMEVVRPAIPVSETPIVSTSAILRFDPSAEGTESIHRVRISGRVLAAFRDGRLFLRDESVPESSVAIAVDLAKAGPRPSLGSRITVAGFPSMKGFSAEIEDALVLETEPGELPDPINASWRELKSGQLDAELITLTGTISDLFRSTEGWQMQLENGGERLMATLPGRTALDIMPDSLVTATGILRIESAVERGFRSQPERFRLLLRSPQDLQVLKAPPWWTAQRLFTLVAILLAMLGLGLVWIAMLGRQVARQSRILETRIAREAALEERQRIAREFHDTLEQELAGLSLRLDAATSRPLEDKTQRLLETSRHLVTRIQTEARNLLTDLRTDADAPTDLREAILDLIQRQPANAPQMSLVDSGTIPSLPASMVHHLRMIVQEAMTNVLKHAQAKNVTIQLRHAANELTLSITDDGVGVDPEQTRGAPGHFGCMGIRERCRKLGATVEWACPGAPTSSSAAKACGTRVTVTLPLESLPSVARSLP